MYLISFLFFSWSYTIFLVKFDTLVKLGKLLLVLFVLGSSFCEQGESFVMKDGNWIGTSSFGGSKLRSINNASVTFSLKNSIDVISGNSICEIGCCNRSVKFTLNNNQKNGSILLQIVCEVL